jgi:hypothetical protein
LIVEGVERMEKAAIVIGINSTGELPVLRAAASGAQSFGAWLTGEGFDVRSFVDDNRAVTAVRTPS